MTDAAATEETKESTSLGMLEKMAKRLYVRRFRNAETDAVRYEDASATRKDEKRSKKAKKKA